MNFQLWPGFNHSTINTDPNFTMPGLPTTSLLYLHFDQSGSNQHVLSVLYEGRQCATLIQTCHPHGYWPCLLAVRESGEGEGRRRTCRGKQGLDESVCWGEREGASGMEEEGR